MVTQTSSLSFKKPQAMLNTLYGQVLLSVSLIVAVFLSSCTTSLADKQRVNSFPMQPMYLDVIELEPYDICKPQRGEEVDPELRMRGQAYDVLTSACI